jgi:hypothetical protein
MAKEKRTIDILSSMPAGTLAYSTSRKPVVHLYSLAQSIRNINIYLGQPTTMIGTNQETTTLLKATFINRRNFAESLHT